MVYIKEVRFVQDHTITVSVENGGASCLTLDDAALGGGDLALREKLFGEGS